MRCTRSHRQTEMHEPRMVVMIVGRAVQYLALEVAEIDHVEIDEAEAADAGGGEVEGQGRAEAAGPDQHRRGRLRSYLHLDLAYSRPTPVALHRRQTRLSLSLNFLSIRRHRRFPAVDRVVRPRCS